MTFNFYHDGGDSTLEVPTLGPYLPCTMRKIGGAVQDDEAIKILEWPKS